MPQKKNSVVSFGIGMPANLTEALNTLISSLQKSNELNDELNPYVRACGMMDALAATEKFMQSIWQFKGMKLDQPYKRIRESISSMLDGVEVEEFVSRRRPAAESATTQAFKMDCAVAMDILMHNGAKRLGAASRIARLVPDLDIKPETVADWRDKLIGRSEDARAELFRWMSSAFKETNTTDEVIAYWLTKIPKKRGVHLKKQLNRVVRSRANKKPK